MPSPLTAAANGARLAVRIAPKASSDRIVGVALDADGAAVLQVAVTAAPEDGKANARVIALLAKSLGVAKSDIAIVQGATQRRKLLFIHGEAGALQDRLAVIARGP